MKKGSVASWSDVGALTTAGTVAATIFCCLPFATGVVGAAFAAFGARLMPLQPLFIGLSLTALAFSFYQAYRPGATCSGDTCDRVQPSRQSVTTTFPLGCPSST